MDERIEAPENIAEGPRGLRSVLTALLGLPQNQRDEPQEILYRLGGQESLILADLSKEPFHFYYNDIQGRPAPKMVRDIIQEMTQGTAIFQDYHALKLNEKVKATIDFEVRDLKESHTLPIRRNQLKQAIAEKAWDALEQQAQFEIKIPEIQRPKIGAYRFSFFGSRATSAPETSTIDIDQKPPKPPRNE